MKWLQCEHCKAGAYGGASGRFPDGEPMVVGTISHFPYRFKCSKCLRVSVVTPAQWSLLPKMTPEEVVELGLLPQHGKLANVDDAGTTPAELRDHR